MIINIRVIPNAKKNALQPQPDGSLRVYLTVPPADGKANKALITLLARHYQKRKSDIEITKGLKSRNKTVSIMGEFFGSD